MAQPTSYRILEIFLTASIAMIIASGCYNHRVVVRAEDPTQVSSERQTHNQFFWGLIGNATTDVDCKSKSLYEVNVSTTFWQGLATGVTLGIWAPATVEWKCATVPATEIDVPIPGAAERKE